MIKHIPGICIAGLLLFTACNNNKDSQTPGNTDTTSNTNTAPAVNNPVDNNAEPANQSSYKYDESVTITGKIGTETFYGAPGYGENPATDKKENPFLLILDKPIDVIGDPNPEDDSKESKSGVSKIQLIFDEKAIDMKAHMGTYVRLTGTLFGAHTGHHHTPVLMDVISAVPHK